MQKAHACRWGQVTVVLVRFDLNRCRAGAEDAGNDVFPNPRFLTSAILTNQPYHRDTDGRVR